MHPGDRLGPLPDGATCTACGAGVPAKRIRILAHRDDLAFVELGLPELRQLAPWVSCSPSDEPGDPPVLDVAVDPWPMAPSAPIDAADVTRDARLPGRLGRRPARTPGGWPVTPAFAHASEAEMARILDFYAVRWEYEPDTFPILWNTDGDVVESFSPDFFLPDLDLYLEMTTLRQKLVRKKNRKLRRLRELYPNVEIKLFYARDFRALMLKYGRLALADALSGHLRPGRRAASGGGGGR